MAEGPSNREKVVEKLKEHPLIPAGILATCGALGMAFRRLHQRDSVGYQRWLRARVLTQGLTIVAIVAAGVQEWGMGALSGNHNRPTASPSQQRAFEKRMREAEDAHRAETAAERGPSVESSAPVQRSTLEPTRDPSEKTAPRSTWLSWLGLSKS